MELNWAPTYPDGKSIIVRDDNYRDEWLMDRFSAEQLLENPYLIRKMSARMCELFLAHYRGKRILNKTNKKDSSISITDTKNAVQERLREVNRASSEYDFTKNKQTLLEQYNDEINTLADRVALRPGTRERELRVHGQKNRSTLFDFPATLTGLISEAAYESREKNPKALLIKEHFFPRTALATYLAEVVINNKLNDPTYQSTPACILPTVYVASFCSITTPSENQDLIKYQGTNVFESPADAYRKAGIRMVITDDVKVHYSWANLATIFNKPLPLPKVSDFDTDGTGLFVEVSQVRDS
jgi:hypothetical protein